MLWPPVAVLSMLILTPMMVSFFRTVPAAVVPRWRLVVATMSMVFPVVFLSVLAVVSTWVTIIVIRRVPSMVLFRWTVMVTVFTTAGFFLILPTVFLVFAFICKSSESYLLLGLPSSRVGDIFFLDLAFLERRVMLLCWNRPRSWPIMHEYLWCFNLNHELTFIRIFTLIYKK